MNSYAPTNAAHMPAKMLWRWDIFTAEAKLAYIKLNIQTPCPPRSAVPVNSRAWFRKCVSTQHARFAFDHGCDCSNSLLEG